MAPGQIAAVLNLVAADVEDLVKASKTFWRRDLRKKGWPIGLRALFHSAGFRKLTMINRRDAIRWTVVAE